MIATILCLILAIGLGLAIELLRMSGGAKKNSDAASLQEALDRLSAYEPMRRLFARGELDDLEGRPDLAVSLRSSRRRAMRLYLRRLRRDFMTVWSTCKMLAPVSDDPDFVMHLMRQLVVFHGLFAVLEMRAVFGYWAAIDGDLARMAGTLQGIREEAAGLLQAATPAASGASA